MTRPVYFADQDFNDHILRGVRRLEPTVQFLRVREVGLQEADDNVLLAYAADKRMIVLSHDVNTMSATAWGRVESGEVRRADAWTVLGSATRSSAASY